MHQWLCYYARRLVFTKRESRCVVHLWVLGRSILLIGAQAVAHLPNVLLEMLLLRMLSTLNGLGVKTNCNCLEQNDCYCLQALSIVAFVMCNGIVKNWVVVGRMVILWLFCTLHSILAIYCLL
ncbi:unnamed protein product [Fraxinus pennsylvanica]|uniref:Uncharacterized protein n=1 Tax=Fraxinus pennsylvanica TaxID=56036 RepID=A0AAD1ZBF4_9LAMI|nr:unnamed protein product [Fraxinus pennsylvanica]